MIPDTLKHLIPLEPEDLPVLKTWLTDSRVYRNLYTLYYPHSLGELETWFLNEKNNGAHIFRYASSSDKTSGIALVHYIHRKNRYGEISYIINPQLQGKGLGREVLSSLLAYCFSILNLHKVFFHTTDYNHAMKHIALSSGLILEGTYRREIFFDGEYHDILRFGILAEEFTALQKI